MSSWEDQQMSTEDQVGGIVQQVAAKACDLLSEGAAAPFCEFFFSDTGIAAIVGFFNAIIPRSWQATGAFDWWSISSAVIPHYEEAYQNTMRLLDQSWCDARSSLGLPPADSPVSAYLNEWLSQNGWQEGGSATPGYEHHLWLEPAKGPWAYAYSAWPSDPDTDHQLAFRDALIWLYNEHRLGPLKRGTVAATDFMKARLAREVKKRQLAVVQRGWDKVDLFLVGEDGGIWTRKWLNSTSWADWQRVLDFQAMPGAPVTAISRHPGQLDVFSIGLDSCVWVAASTEEVANGAWYGWWNLCGVAVAANSPIAVASRNPNQLDLFAVGQDRGIYAAAWNANVAGGVWQGWWRIGSLRAAPGSHLAAIARTPTKLDVFVIGEDGAMWWATWDAQVAGGWRGWTRLPEFYPHPCSTLSVVARKPTNLDLFAGAPDGSVWIAATDDVIDHGGWRGWWNTGLGWQPGAAVAAVSYDPNQLNVFTIGLDGNVCYAAWDANLAGGIWRCCWQVPGGVAATDSPLAIETRGPNLIDVFMLGQDRAVWEADWNGQEWLGWWNNGP
jgi:hypothetical protein